jgi:hypothetical protein
LPTFVLHPDKDDGILAGLIITTSLEQTYDIILISETPEGLQRKMDALWKWCSKYFMVINAVESYAMIFGPLPLQTCQVVLSKFSFGGAPVAIRLGFLSPPHQEIFLKAIIRRRLAKRVLLAIWSLGWSQVYMSLESAGSPYHTHTMVLRSP